MFQCSILIEFVIGLWTIVHQEHLSYHAEFYRLTLKCSKETVFLLNAKLICIYHFALPEDRQ